MTGILKKKEIKTQMHRDRIINKKTQGEDYNLQAKEKVLKNQPC
jgi:hypothetical protein